jgi:hypothetical protein
METKEIAAPNYQIDQVILILPDKNSPTSQNISALVRNIDLHVSDKYWVYSVWTCAGSFRVLEAEIAGLCEDQKTLKSLYHKPYMTTIEDLLNQ